MVKQLTYKDFVTDWINPIIEKRSELSLIQKKEALRKLRQQGRKTFFQILKGNLINLSGAQLQSEEIRFGVVLRILNQLENDLEKEIGIPPIQPESFDYPLLDLWVEGCSKATCTTQLFFSPSAHYFTHGPDIVAYAALLTKKILQPGEKIQKVEKVSWRRLTVHNLHITAWDIDSLERIENYEYRKATCNSLGTFQTSLGRTIAFIGEEILEDPIHRSASLNKIACDLLVPIKKQVDKDNFTVRYRLNTPSIPSPLAYPTLSSMLVTLDIIGILVGWVESPLGIRFLCTQMKNVTFPEDLSTLKGEEVIFSPKFHLKRKSTKVDMYTVPFEVIITGQEGFQCQGIFACSNQSILEALADLC